LPRAPGMSQLTRCTLAVSRGGLVTLSQACTDSVGYVEQSATKPRLCARGFPSPSVDVLLRGVQLGSFAGRDGRLRRICETQEVIISKDSRRSERLGDDGLTLATCDRGTISSFRRFNLEWKTRTLNLFTQAARRHLDIPAIDIRRVFAYYGCVLKRLPCSICIWLARAGLATECSHHRRHWPLTGAWVLRSMFVQPGCTATLCIPVAQGTLCTPVAQG
jgi:hypothetical protein